jgi:hypothetical protein
MRDNVKVAWEQEKSTASEVQRRKAALEQELKLKQLKQETQAHDTAALRGQLAEVRPAFPLAMSGPHHESCRMLLRVFCPERMSDMAWALDRLGGGAALSGFRWPHKF